MADKQRSGGGGGGPRDLLRHFASPGGDESPAGEEDSGDIELSLGLSLGGTFGVDPKAKRLVRSSSSSLAYALAPSLSARDVEEEEERRRRQALVRTCSLPLAADEEDDRKRRAGLVMGRAEAKRKREGEGGWGFGSGTWAGVPPPPAANTSNSGGEDGGLPRFVGRNGGVISFGTGQAQGQGQLQGQGQRPQLHPVSQQGQGQGQRPQLQPVSQQAQPAPRQIFAQPASQGSRGMAVPPLVSQGSLGSQGSSMTATTPDTDSRPSTQAGHNNHVGSKDLSTVQQATNHSIEQAASIFPGSSLASNNNGNAGENQAGSSRSNGSLEIDRAIGDQMPSVFTKGDGPNGRIIEGFLYKYKKVEEVRIVCVCHGIFLTPAEFIKHAGGSDVAHPLRHIVVKPPSTSFL